MKIKIIFSVFCIILAITVPLISAILVYTDGQKISIACTENYASLEKENPFDDIKITGDIYDGISLMNFTIDKGKVSHNIKYLGNNGQYDTSSYAKDDRYYNRDTGRSRTIVRNINNNLSIIFCSKNGDYMYFKDMSYQEYYEDISFEGADIYEINNRYYVVPNTFGNYARGTSGIYDITDEYLSEKDKGSYSGEFDAREVSSRPVGIIRVESGKTEIIASEVSGEIIVVAVKNTVENNVYYAFKLFDTSTDSFIKEIIYEFETGEADFKDKTLKTWVNGKYITFEILHEQYSDLTNEEDPKREKRVLYVTVDVVSGDIVSSPVIRMPYQNSGDNANCILFKDNTLYVVYTTTGWVPPEYQEEYNINLAAYKDNECIYLGKLECNIEYDTVTKIKYPDYYESIPRKNRKLYNLKME